MLIVLFVAGLFEPRFFQMVLGALIRVEAWRQGAEVEFERVGGSFFEPVVLGNSRWTFRSDAGATTRVEIAKLEAELVWRNLFQRTTARWFQRLSVTGVKGKLFLPLAGPADTKPRRRPWLNWRPPGGRWTPVPTALEGNDIDFFFQGGNDFVRLEECRFTASDVDRGEFHAGRVTIRQPWLARTFKNVQGTTAMQDEKFVVANVVLDPGVEIRSLSAELPQLARGRLNLEMNLAAFDGTLKAEAATVPRDHGLAFEAGGKFAQVNIAKFASFFALSDAAGGTIKEGSFSFRGSPQNPAKATARLQFDAANFQWETRQWDSLTLGLVLTDGRLQVPRFDLHQGKNTLTVSGELTLPDAAERWWHGAFNCAVKARIGNLTELSALLLPEFTYAAGEASIDGNIRGHGEEFFGQLIVEGHGLTWRNAPIQALHATVKLDGKELKVAHMELVNGDDYLRGNGVVNLFGPTQYWGELRIAAEDLASYAAFLQKPVLPEPLAGGGIIDWTGEGSAAAGHSGKFMARLRKVRTLGALAQQLHPINADLEASYGPGVMNFSKFMLSDDDSSFTANIAVGDKALNLSGIQLRHKQQLQLEGDALLPFDVWQKWPNVSLGQLLSDDVVSRVNLTAHALDLAAAAQLSGWKFPVAGTLDGTFNAEGAINALKLGGTLKLAHGRIPLGSSSDALDGAEGDFSFAENAMQIAQFKGRHPCGDLEIGGSVQFANPRDPNLQLTVRAPKATLPVFRGATPNISVDTAFDLELTGPLSAALVRGQAKVSSLAVDAVPDFTPLWRPERRIEVPPLFSYASVPCANWTFDIACTAADPAGLKSGTSEVQLDVHIGGRGTWPTLAGHIELSGLDIGAEAPSTGEPWVDGGAAHLPAPALPPLAHLFVTFFESRPEEPSLDLEVAGMTGRWAGGRGGTPFRASLTGPLNHLIRVYYGPPPLTNEVVRAALSHTLEASPQRISLGTDTPIKLGLGTDAAIAAGVDQYEWMPPAEQPPSGVSTTESIHKDAPQ